MRVIAVYALLIGIALALSCSEGKNPPATGQISFNLLYKTSKNNGIAAAYTDAPDSLWTQREWVGAIRGRMEGLSGKYDTVLLFSSREHTPNVREYGMEYPQRYDRWLVAGYWKYPTRKTRFSYGGTGPDGNFRCSDQWQ